MKSIVDAAESINAAAQESSVMAINLIVGGVTDEVYAELDRIADAHSEEREKMIEIRDQLNKSDRRMRRLLADTKACAKRNKGAKP
jgi:hypothetical protein